MTCPRVGIDKKRYLIALKKEFFRKSIHMCTAFVPLFYHFFSYKILILLALAGILYTVSEVFRLNGFEIPLISYITAAAARKRDENKFVLGPVTLVIGILVALILWNEKSACVGIFALAFGDGLASLVGKTFGKVSVPLTGGKTAAGSLVCFSAIFLVSWLVLHNTSISLAAALAGTIIEGAPLKDYDNFFIPVVLGGITSYLLPHV